MNPSGINVQLLQRLGVPLATAKVFSQPLQDACAWAEINTPKRVAAFLAQAQHESQNFTILQERLNYSTPERIMQVFPSRVTTLALARRLVHNPQELANRVYSGRLGNGDLDSGDGWKYIGRGLIQLTGRSNYAAAEEGTGLPLLGFPELASTPEGATKTAAWFWKTNGCNELADQTSFLAITRKVNGPALLGQAERLAHYRQAITALA